MATLITYKERNVFYLRISATTVLGVILLLDPRHTTWMSDDTLERLLSALRSRIVPKLRKERRESEKKAKVDVYRGAGYQCAYFFRHTPQKHVVLLKDRNVIFHDASTHTNSSQGDIDQQPGSNTDEAIALVKPEPTDDEAPLHGASGVHTIIDDADESQKPDVKPVLQVSYNGFAIFGRTLIVIIEPWPALSAHLWTPAAPDPSEAIRQLSSTPGPSAARAPSKTPAPPTSASAAGLFRAETPVTELGDEGLSEFRARSQSVFGDMRNLGGLEDE